MRPDAQRVAIVHDRLVEFGGGEQVLACLLAMWPGADLFTMVYDRRGPCGGLPGGRTVRTSFIQRLPQGARRYRMYMPLMPLAVEQFDFSDYDLVLSSSYAVAHGAVTGAGQTHVAYIHSPLRYAWDMQEDYLRGLGLLPRLAARLLFHFWRGWDRRAGQAVQSLACNSRHVAGRIREAYGREAAVIHPPVDVDGLSPAGERGNYFLSVSRLVPYKRVDVLVEAFRELPDERLVIVGGGPEARRLTRRAPANVTFLGWQSREALAKLFAGARAFVYAAREDFGISLVEAQACGTPVVAFRGGGALETVVEGVTGMFFDVQTPASLAEAIRRFPAREGGFFAAELRANAARFRKEIFASKFREHVAAAVAEHGRW
jgi:glycosyltransferase involved in cell wall biosynthesis